MGQYQVHLFNDWVRAFQEMLSDDPEFSSLPQSVIAYLSELELSHVIEESNYVDADYGAAFSHFYSHLFFPPPRNCTRYLFFSADQQFTIDRLGHYTKPGYFKGFLVKWPTDPPVIGRTVLPTPKGVPASASVTYKAHVGGEEFELETVMFASKDYGVSVCATVATWLATDILHPMEAWIEYQGGRKKHVQIDMFIIPLPAGVSLVDEDAHPLGRQAIWSFANGKQGREVLSALIGDGRIGPIRTVLKESVKLKEEAKQWEEIPGASKAIREWAMSKWVWVSEAYQAGLKSLEGAAPVARVILDSTQSKYAKKSVFLVGHVGNKVIEGPFDLS